MLPFGGVETLRRWRWRGTGSKTKVHSAGNAEGKKGFRWSRLHRKEGHRERLKGRSRKSLAKSLCEAGALGVGGRVGWAVEDWRKTQHIQNTVIQAVASIRVTTNANRPGAEKHTVQLETAGLLVQGNSLFDNRGSGPTVRKRIKQCKIKSLTKPEFLN